MAKGTEGHAVPVAGSVCLGERTKSALIETYMEKRAELRRFLVARFRDETIADDILQEMFLKLERSSFDKPITNATAFLYRVANNLALDLRKQAIRQKGREKDWGETSTHQVSGEPVDDSVDVTVSIDAQKKVDRIVALLDDLPPQCRRVFVAHKFEGLSHREVAERFEISRSTVEKHMSKAMKYIVLH
ncbi:MAG: RNA polymerase sigma factor, partial [Kordiimonas sp.]